MSTIEMTHVGPIDRLEFTVPENGGLVVLRARNGKGKTKALDSIQSLVSGKGNVRKVSVKDGELHGEVKGFGAVMTIGRSAKHKGELEVATLEGKLDVSNLVDPGIIDPAAADASRIRTLVQVAGADVDPSLFYDLVGGQKQFEALIPIAGKEYDDVVQLANRIKRDLEGHARLEESQSETCLGRCAAFLESAKGIDLDSEKDEHVLQAALETAIRNQTEIKNKAEQAKAAESNAAAARVSLDAAKAAGTVTIAEAEESERVAVAAYDTAKESVALAEEQLRTAQANRDRAKLLWDAALDNRRSVIRQQALIAGWESAIETAARVTVPTDAEIAEALASVESTRKAVENGALARKAFGQIQSAEQDELAAKDHTERAKLLRDAARGTDDVLSKQVASLGTPLKVEAGRLVLKTDRGTTYFGELSHGERWKLAIDVCVRVVGATGVLTIPQEAFESLDPMNREAIAEHAASRGVLIITAEASDDEEITAEVYEPALPVSA